MEMIFSVTQPEVAACWPFASYHETSVRSHQGVVYSLMFFLRSFNNLSALESINLEERRPKPVILNL